MSPLKIALIGYGEVGRILAEALAPSGHTLTAFDPKQLDSETRRPIREHAASYGVTLCESHHDAVREAELVVSAVTASQAEAAASACAGALPKASFFLDLNSASPGQKLAAAAVVTTAGGRYVEGAVMAAVPPYGIKVPLLLGGPDASALAPVLERLGFAARVTSDRLGVASATKLCRSVMIKGLEATLIESLTTARFYGVEDAVLASLRETFPGIDWETQAAYFFQRMVAHGARRSEEMREAAVTVQEAGLSASSAAATAERQAWMAALADQGVFGARTSRDFARSTDFRTEADRILRHLRDSAGR